MITEPADSEAALLPLMLWLSSAFPVGAFAYSHGLEWAVELGDIVDARTLGGWLVDLLSFGSPRADSIQFAAAFRAAKARDERALLEANALCIALAPSAERRRATICRSRRAFRPSSWRLAPTSSPRSCGLGHRPDSGAEDPGRAPRRASARWRARPPAPHSPTSAQPPSAPTSPRCATRRNIRDCSGRKLPSSLAVRAFVVMSLLKLEREARQSFAAPLRFCDETRGREPHGGRRRRSSGGSSGARGRGGAPRSAGAAHSRRRR